MYLGLAISSPIHRESKKCHHTFFPYLRQILTDFKNSFTVTLFGKFAICNKAVINYLTTPELRRYNTL